MVFATGLMGPVPTSAHTVFACHWSVSTICLPPRFSANHLRDAQETCPRVSLLEETPERAAKSQQAQASWAAYQDVSPGSDSRGANFLKVWCVGMWGSFDDVGDWFVQGRVAP